MLYKWGSRGPMVEAIQKVLNDSVFQPPEILKPDGIFGKKTYDMVKAFQSENPPLADDGVVGPKTYAVLNACYQAHLQAAARGLAGIDTTSGQQSSNGVDCGYFAAMVVKNYTASPNSFGALSFTRDEVFQARDSWPGVTIKDEYKGKEQTGSGSHYLLSSKAGSFLSHIGASGFAWTFCSGFGLDKKSDPDFNAFMDKVTRKGEIGAMFACPRFSGRAGHWLAVIGKRVINSTTYYRFYDSSGTIPRVMAKKGILAGKHLGWVSSSETKKLLANSMVGIEQGYISK